MHGPQDVTHLAEALALSVASTSRHLKALRAEGLVEFHGEHARHMHVLSPGVHLHAREDAVELSITSESGTTLTLGMPPTAIGSPLPGVTVVTRTGAKAAASVRPERRRGERRGA